MAEFVDPEKLVSVAQMAAQFGYHPKYFSKLASEKKFKAWRIGNIWVTTRESIESYIRTAPSPGPKTNSAKKRQKPRKDSLHN